MPYKLLAIITFCFFVLQACVYDCLSNHDGIVTDKYTSQPIAGVNVCVLWDDTIINDYGLIHDSLPINQRKLLLDSSNYYDWWDPEDGTNRMARRAPFFTDSAGYYKIKLFTGLAPKHLRLIFLKAGYQPFITSELDPITTINIQLHRIDKSSLVNNNEK